MKIYSHQEIMNACHRAFICCHPSTHISTIAFVALVANRLGMSIAPSAKSFQYLRRYLVLLGEEGGLHYICRGKAAGFYSSVWYLPTTRLVEVRDDES